MKKGDHVVVKNTPKGGQLFCCKHCGAEYEPRLPVSIDMFTGMMKLFYKEHKSCTPRQSSEGEDNAN